MTQDCRTETRPASIEAVLQRNALLRPAAEVLIDADRSLGAAEYWRLICAAAAQLRSSCGLSSGSRAALICTQDVPFLVALHAVRLLGAVAVPLEKNAAPERVRSVLEQTEAVLLITPRPLPDAAVPCMSAASLLAAAEQHTVPTDPPLPDAENSSLILFTTGTTGATKGIELTHGADAAVAENVCRGIGQHEGQREILAMPLNHSFALRRYFSVMLCGGCCLLLNGLLAPGRLFRYLEQERADAIALAPSGAEMLLRLSEQRLAACAPQLDYMQFGSAPLSEELKQRLRLLLPGVRLYNIYGSTEAGCASVLEFSGADDRPHCIGRPTCNSRVRLLDADGGEITAPGIEGRLCWGGEMLMRGYWREPELTAATLRGGYIVSSDLGRFDSEGRLYMLGRCDDVINRGGLKISPQEVEDAALTCRRIAECACVGTPDPVEGVAVTLYAVIAAPADADNAENADNAEDAVRDELLTCLRAALEPYMLPRYIVFLTSLPRTYNGKLDRRALRLS